MKSILLKAQFFVILFLLIGETTFAQWQKVNDIDSFPRARPTSFVIGDTAYLGNGDINSGYTTLFAGYTQNSNTWSSVPTYPGGGGDWGFRFVINNRAYVGGGANPAYQNGFYKYAPTTGWTSLGTAPGGILRAFSAGFSIGNKGYVGTGSSSASILLNDFWEYDTLANTWTSEAAFPGAPRTGSVAFAANGYGYIGLGGNSTTGTTYNDMYRYNPGTGKWDTMAPLPTPWGMAAAGYFVLCGKLVVTCGDTVPNVQNTSKKAWLFDPYNGTKGKWTPLPEFPGPLPDYYSPGGFTMGDTGFIYGGFNHLTNNGTAEMYRFIPTPALLDMLVSPVDTTICSGNPITLKGASSVSYIWNTSDTTSNITVSPTTSTIYTVSEISGSCLFIDTVHVNVSPSTSVTITPDSPSMCSGQSVILSVTDTGTNFTWSPSTGLSATTGDSVVANDTATIVYSVIGTSSGGCAFSGTDTVKIIPAPALIIQPQSPKVCNGQGVTLYAPASGTGYTWSSAAAITPSGDSATATPTVTTTYSVTGTDSVGCVATGTDSVYIIPALPLIILPQPPPSFCSGSSAELKVKGGGTDFIWTPITGLSDTTSGDSVLAGPTLTTTYTVSGNDSLGCASTGTEKVIVFPAPIIPTFTQSGNTLKSSAQYQNQWYLNDTLLVGDTSQYLTITTGGEYRVSVTNEANGCSSASDSANITTGINQLSVISAQLSIYPNPFTNNLFIKINTSAQDVKDWTLQITDVLGQTVYNQLSLNYSNAIDLSNLSSGVYFITVISKTGRAVFPVIRQNY